MLNLSREFEIQRMKKSETINEYCNRLLGVVNKIRSLEKDLSNQRVVGKIIVTLFKVCELKVSFLEESKRLSSISLAKFLNVLRVHKQKKIN